ncbi:MAG: FAD-dependent oxidoreductase [Chromatiales bacterium]|nr:FAD-dependent oxidoreductase [Chromatiales bacterium]
MSGEVRDLVVIGGGISGLGLAHMAARKGLRPLILEADQRVGGALCSHQHQLSEGLFWTELGAHTCYNSYGNLLQMLEDLDSLDTLRAKEKLSYRLLTVNGIKSIPSQLGFFELLTSVPKLFSLKKQGKTVADYFSAIVGKGNYRRVVGPALDAVICQDASDFPAEALFRKKPRRKEVLRNYTSERGVEQFVQIIAEQEALEIKLGTPVSAIAQNERGYLITTPEGELQTRRVALAVAPDVVARLLAGVLPEMAELLNQIEMVDIESVAVVVAAKDCPVEPLAGIIAPNDRFFSSVSRDPLADPHYRGFSFHFRPEGLSLEAKLTRIGEVLGVAQDDILSVEVRQNRLPALRLGHDQIVARLDGVLAGQALAVTGNWFDGVSIEDSLIRSAAEAERICQA